MPTHTKVSFAPSTVKRIAENEKVLGFKDSSANGAYLQSVIYEMKENEDFSIFVGPEEMMAEAVLLGADGGVNGGANMFPKLYVDLYNAAKQNNIDEVRILHSKVMQICATIYNNGKYGSSYLKGLKSGLSVLGICNDYLAMPFTKFDVEYRQEVINAIEVLNLEKVLL